MGGSSFARQIVIAGTCVQPRVEQSDNASRHGERSIDALHANNLGNILKD
jgi:hypothetical protein